MISEQYMEVEGLLAIFTGKDPDISKYEIVMAESDVVIRYIGDGERKIIFNIDKCDWFDFLNLLNDMTKRFEDILTIAKG